jgi:hypothetical protein
MGTNAAQIGNSNSKTFPTIVVKIKLTNIGMMNGIFGVTQTLL